MPSIPLLCRNATPFAAAGGIDEEAFRQYLQRFVDAGLGVYLASGGSGEGHALTPDELDQVYRIGVAVCRGKVPVYANPPERHTALDTIAESLRAARAGVEVVNVYGPASWHGYRPTDDELHAYYDEVLAAVRHPVAIAPNPIIGYTPKPAAMAAICRRHSQVVAINLSGLGEAYFVELLDATAGKIDIYVPIDGAPHMVALGAKGLLAAEANILPKTFRRYLDALAAGDTAAMAHSFAEIRRLTSYARAWGNSPRWLKMTMKLLRLPGGEGGVRAPYRMPAPEEQQRYLDGLLRLGIAEITEAAAGLTSSPAAS